MEKRQEIRFPVTLKINRKENNQECLEGTIKDFSRNGLRAIFDNFESKSGSYLDIEIERPNTDVFTPAKAEFIWKRPAGGKWEVGFRLKEFIPLAKAEILENAYENWLQNKTFALQDF